MRYRVFMADEDLSYLSKLELMLLREYGDQIELHLITDSDYLEELFRTSQKIDVLVIAENFWKEEYRKQGISRVFFLTETEEPTKIEPGVTNIYKYSSVQNVVHTINVVLRHLIKGTVDSIEKKIVMVYSPQGGCGKTTLAVGTAKALFQLGNKVLYIDAESLQTFLEKNKEDSWASRSLISALYTGRFSKEILESNIVKGDIEYLMPMQYSLLSNGIRDMNYISLIHSAKELLVYDYIIVDTSSDFNDFKAQLIAMSDQVIIPCLQDIQGAVKMEAMLRNINVSDKKKYIFVCNKFRIGEENKLVDTAIWQMINYKIPYRNQGEQSGNSDTMYMEVAYSLI